MVEQEMTTVPMERRPHCEKGMQQSDAESLSGFPGWELSAVELAIFLDAQATAANSQEILQPERAGEVPQGYQACPSPDP